MQTETDAQIEFSFQRTSHEWWLVVRQDWQERKNEPHLKNLLGSTPTMFDSQKTSYRSLTWKINQRVKHAFRNMRDTSA